MKTKLRILNLEDNPNDHDLITSLLAEEGIEHEMTRVEGREAFIEEFEKGGYDLVLADNGLPRFDGLSALQILREKDAGIPFIFVTGSMGEELAVETLKSGANDYVLKTRLFKLPVAVRRVMAEREHIVVERKALDELRSSQERFRSLFDNMLEGYAYCKIMFEEGIPVDFMYIDVNKSFESLTGLKDVVGKKASEVIPGIRESNPELLQIYGRVALTGMPERFVTYVEPLKFWFSVSVYSPEKEFFIAVFDNITEHKKAEDSLRESEERFRSVAESAADAIICLKRPDTVYFWNRRAEVMFGYTLEEAMSKHMHELIVPRDCLEKASKGLGNFFQNGTGPLVGKTVEVTGVQKSGEEFPVELSISAMNIHGEWHATGIIRDISERKKTENDLKEHLEELQRFHNATIEREFRIHEVKEENERLKKKIEEMERG